MDTTWDDEIGGLLHELAAVQGELLGLLDEKRRLLVKTDLVGLAAMHDREQAIVGRLQSCHERRAQLLVQAQADALPADSIRSLAAALPVERAKPLRAQLVESGARWRLLQHQCLANWVLAQRSIVHLAQLLEIIATGGKPRPTYGNGPPSGQQGALLDQAA
ncbi:MAG: flagellar protein FlgN [Pirellulales bacterium]|nr:flagellar protein FlgN [Pirellulales bacterium]